jgi:uncharacterized protein YciI
VDDIDFLLYSRAAGGEPDSALTEAHWTYMDQFADGMTARGPTLAPDRATWTGSLHIVDLPNADAAREFVEREPYNRAGLFDGHVIRRFKNVLGRTMWDFPRKPAEPRFVVIAHLRAPAGEHVPVAPRADFTTLSRERLIVYGELFTPDEAAPAGVLLAFQAPTREVAGSILRDGLAGPEKYFDLEIHDWEFGGRR